MKQLSWTTTSEYVDLETGEVLTKQNANKNYIIKSKKKYVTKNSTRGQVTIINECTKHGRQYTIW